MTAFIGALLLLLSLGALFLGFIFLSEATTGVGLIGIAAVLGIYVRLLQADMHNKQTDIHNKQLKAQLQKLDSRFKQLKQKVQEHEFDPTE